VSGEDKDPRKTNMAITFMLMTFAIGGVAAWAFWDQWVLFDALMADNPIFLFLLFVCLATFPMLVTKIVGDRSYKKVGDEAENIARNLRP
jgi:hypothetical protein